MMVALGFLVTIIGCFAVYNLPPIEAFTSADYLLVILILMFVGKMFSKGAKEPHEQNNQAPPTL